MPHVLNIEVSQEMLDGLAGVTSDLNWPMFQEYLGLLIAKGDRDNRKQDLDERQTAALRGGIKALIGLKDNFAAHVALAKKGQATARDSGREA